MGLGEVAEDAESGGLRRSIHQEVFKFDHLFN